MTKPKKILSLSYNFFRNLELFALDKEITLVKMKNSIYDSANLRGNFRPNQSPARNLSNLFWSQLNFDVISEYLDGPVSSIEIGCGTGVYANYITKNHPENSYLGIDIEKSNAWETFESSSISFVQDTYLHTEDYLDQRNFVFTQSAVEHFDFDLDFFQVISQNSSNSKLPRIAIHLLPGSSALGNYLWHGIRQYPLRAINKISQITKGKSFILVLGGSGTNQIHRKYITYPSIFKKFDRRTTEPREYIEQLISQVQFDAKCPKTKSATFLVLIQAFNLQDNFEASELFSDK